MVRQSFSRLLGFNGGPEAEEKVTMVPIRDITMNPYQPRRDFDEEGLEELSSSIREHGIIQPVILRRNAGKYELVAGERRLRASRRVGLERIPGVVKDLSDAEVAEMALIENLQRKNLNFMEEARGYRNLIEGFDITQKQLAHRIGKSQSTIANKLRLLKLPDRVRQRVVEAEISERHARALLQLEEEELQLEVLEQIIEEELTVRETEELITARENGRTDSESQQRLTAAYKDIRLFQNAIHDTIDQIKKAGLQPDVDEVEAENFIEIKIRLPKNHGQETAQANKKSKRGRG